MGFKELMKRDARCCGLTKLSKSNQSREKNYIFVLLKEHSRLLSARAVAYLNVDMSVDGKTI